jgi:hypothetical protein
MDAIPHWRDACKFHAWSGFKKTVAGARRSRRFSIILQIRVEAG